MAEVVLFLHADGAVGEEDEGPVARQSAHRVIGVDPGVHARGSLELRPRRPQLGRDDLAVAFQLLNKNAQPEPSEPTENSQNHSEPQPPILTFLCPLTEPRWSGCTRSRASRSRGPRRRSRTLPRLRQALGAGPALIVKRDDAIPLGFGGNKIRKLQIVAAQALAAGADTLITTGGLQSNHARATASIAARLGLRCVLVANGDAAGQADGECAARPSARRRDPLRGLARGPGAGHGGMRPRSCARRAAVRSSFHSAPPPRTAPPPMRWR